MISIIIVNYKVKKELVACIEYIYASEPKVSYEIIVVDNDEKKTIQTDLKKRFPKVKYIKNENKGFGQGNNAGAQHAKGEYLFFLNPDTKVLPGAVDNLVTFLKKHKDVGIVAPLLHDMKGKTYQQGTLELTPLRGIICLSVINKLFPHNPIAQKYFLHNWDRKTVKEVDVAPGTAFMIRRSLFKKLSGFDENFFLFFEEFDLCKRVREAGYKIFIYPKARVTHAWGASTKQRSDIQTIFEKSRFYYFKKHFGILNALLTEIVLRFSKYTALLLLVLSVGLFLRVHNLYESMPFIGDQGWYYLSARDMVLTGNVPLVGIASSHPWLHQGALWTYMLAVSLWGFGFSPFVGAYISIFLGMLGILGMYWLGSAMFSRKAGIIAAALFAVSPLVIASDRMPYHTSPIPLFTILYIYCLFRWVKGNVSFFPLVIFLLGILYNFELATALLGMVTVVIWLYGYMAKKEWAVKVLRIKYLVLSIIAFVVSMLPMLIYDIWHGFPQTLGFVAWLGYKVLVMFGYPPINPSTPVLWSEMISFSAGQIKQLIFPYSWVVAVGAFVGSLIVASRQVTRLQLPSQSDGAQVKSSSTRLILFLNIILIFGFLAARTASDAYWQMIFPVLLLLIAIWLDGWMVHRIRVVRLVGVIGVIGVICFNSYYSFVKNNSDDSFTRRLAVAKYIVKETGGREYNLRGKGLGSQFESFTMNYEYLTWWLGNGPSKADKPLRFIISEEKGIKVENKQN